MGQTHRISFEPVDIEMEVDEDENILDAAFRQGIHLMHGCREGQCSACKSFLLDGDIQMDRYSTFACNDATRYADGDAGGITTIITNTRSAS